MKINNREVFQEVTGNLNSKIASIFPLKYVYMTLLERGSLSHHKIVKYVEMVKKQCFKILSTTRISYDFFAVIKDI